MIALHFPFPFGVKLFDREGESGVYCSKMSLCACGFRSRALSSFWTEQRRFVSTGATSWGRTSTAATPMCRRRVVAPTPFLFSSSSFPTLWCGQQQKRWHADVKTGDRDKPLKLTWELPSGEKKEVTAYDGQNLLEVAQENDLPVEGACAGACACSTCHVILQDNDFENFPEADDKELDMLDLAFMSGPTSRLGCQIKLNAEKHDGMVVTLPKATRNMAVDGYVAKPH